MLDVIADFWKPVKKAPQAETLKPELLQIGSTMGFGFVPQAMLSGRRLTINTINTYLFGEESLTSFVLAQDKDPSVSMIVAESEGEYYLAISRRISLADRTKLFDEQELEAVMSKQDASRLGARENVADYKGWIVPSYKREIQGLKGIIFKGDYRKAPLPETKDGSEFEYTLLVSDSNEHAIEIERYTDGRVEVYATVYRRMNDIGEISHPAPVTAEVSRPDVKLASSTDIKPSAAQTPVMSAPTLKEVSPESEFKGAGNTAADPVLPPEPKAPEIKEPAKEPEVKEPEQKPSESAHVAEAAKTEPLTLRELPAAPLPVIPASYTDTPAQVEQVNPGVFAVNIPASATSQKPFTNEARTDMSTATAEAMKPKLYVNQTGPDASPDAKKMSEGDNIECDLRVANKIIDEAIRNEMRLTDIVRRIIELPVAYPESVQIPMTLTDSDYSLLAIRYGISASDRNAIKRRIIEDLNDFSGKK